MPSRSDEPVLASFRARLGKVPDQKIADEAGVSRTLVVNYRKKLGIGAYEGHKNPKPDSGAVSVPERSFRGRRSALDPLAHLLGKLPDSEVARRAGVTTENVRTYRQRRRIGADWRAAEGAEAEQSAPERLPGRQSPSWKGPSNHPNKATEKDPSGRDPAEPARRVSPPEAPAVSVAAELSAHTTVDDSVAFLVLVDTHEGARSYALVAADIASAAAAAATRVASRHPNATIRSIQRVAELLP